MVSKSAWPHTFVVRVSVSTFVVRVSVSTSYPTRLVVHKTLGIQMTEGCVYHSILFTQVICVVVVMVIKG